MTTVDLPVPLLPLGPLWSFSSFLVKFLTKNPQTRNDVPSNVILFSQKLRVFASFYDSVTKFGYAVMHASRACSSVEFNEV